MNEDILHAAERVLRAIQAWPEDVAEVVVERIRERLPDADLSQARQHAVEHLRAAMADTVVELLRILDAMRTATDN
jgi:hypothetical protein